MTLGKFRKLTEKLPDDTVLIGSGDPLAQWTEPIVAAAYGSLDRQGEFWVRNRVTRTVNCVLLWLR